MKKSYKICCMLITKELSVDLGNNGQIIDCHSLSLELSYWIPARWMLAGFFKLIILRVLFRDLDTLFLADGKKAVSFKLLFGVLDIVC